MLGLWAGTLTQLIVFADRPADLLAGVALVLVAALLAVHLAAAGLAPRAERRASRLRAWVRRRRVPRQVDPDAPGRPRPRAPGAHPSAA
ncbi:hypothetical protein D7223_28060 [Micromonospora endolithica]|uniref:Uncharacterized protein n=2 Tax=Micromonospora endolithica TaxID=230091 RepID=A0A3A9YXQ1_9ACTN|nr:hypothetical protein D7223_28060 [Micromonospora endolithica]TWJ26164.1 hypothetical protein JD76_06344 [Micromonospora endolithica]